MYYAIVAVVIQMLLTSETVSSWFIDLGNIILYRKITNKQNQCLKSTQIVKLIYTKYDDLKKKKVR